MHTIPKKAKTKKTFHGSEGLKQNPRCNLQCKQKLQASLQECASSSRERCSRNEQHSSSTSEFEVGDEVDYSLEEKHINDM